MRVQRLVMPGSGVESWTLLGDDHLPVEPVERFLAYLGAIERSPNTVKAYAHDLKDWFVFLGGRGVDWAAVTLEDVAAFAGWLRLPPAGRAGQVAVLPSAETYCSTDPTAGDLWEVALLGLHPNASRPWAATHGGGGLPVYRACLAAGNREGLGPRHPAAPAAAPGDAPLLPGRVPHPDRRRAGRPGDPGVRRLHPDHRRYLRATPRRRHPVLGAAPQPAALPVLPGHRTRPRQWADGRGA
jgi:hypothetical protein